MEGTGGGLSAQQKKHGTRDPIAIIGAACRLPGAESVADFWDLLVTGKDAIASIERTRMEANLGRYSEFNHHGGFVSGIDQFDADFFGISEYDAVRLDPQHRLLLETAWEALEDGGLTAERTAGSLTGVYTAALPSGYWDVLRAAGCGDLAGVVGAGPWQSAAGRISYEFDLRGPSMGLEATCSTSLLGVHLGCRALWAQEIDMAIVGAANVVIDAEVHAMLENAGLLSPSRRCRFGDAAADGYVRGEGAVTVILKRLSEAMRDGDRVYATIIGSSAAHDGRSGQTQFAPGFESQRDLLRRAYADAGVSPGIVGYVEAHGTGTRAGDPIELTALREVLGDGRQRGRPCLVGSVKSNIGHCEAVAGLAGLLKAALSVRHAIVPPSLHVSSQHSALSEARGVLELPMSPVEWPRGDGPAIAGVSAFGVSGANAHVVLAEPPSRRPRRAAPRDQVFLLPLSARSPEALARLSADYADRLETLESASALSDVCFSAGERRTHHQNRLAVLSTAPAAIAGDLRTFAADGDRDAVITGDAPADRPPRIVFAFAGQGARLSWRSGDLLTACRPFAQRMRECDQALLAEVGWSARQRLARHEDLTTAADLHPVLWAIQVSLAAVWEDWGIRPDVVLGHSMGEISAATVAGALSLRDAAALVYRRSSLAEATLPKAAMWAVPLGEDAVRDVISQVRGRVYVSVINGPRSVSIGGDVAAVQRVVDGLRERGIACRRIPLDIAPHTPLVEQLRPRMLDLLKDLTPARAAIPILSAARNDMVDGTELDADYWMEHARSPVLFEHCVRRLLAEEPRTVFVELSPHPTLCPAIEDTIASLQLREAVTIPSLDRNSRGLESMLAGLGTAYVQGSAVNWGRVYPRGRYTPLPGHPWNRTRHWPTAAPGSPANVSDSTGRVKKETAPEPAVASPEQLVDKIQTWLAQILAVSKDSIDPHITLPELGIDSVSGLRFAQLAGKHIGRRIPPADVFGGGSTVAGLAASWCDLLRQETTARGRAAGRAEPG